MYAYEIQNNSGLSVADIGFDRKGNVTLVLFEDVGIRYDYQEEAEFDAELLACAGYAVSLEKVWRI